MTKWIESYRYLTENKRLKEITGKENGDEALEDLLTFSTMADIIERGYDAKKIMRIIKT